MRTALRTLVLLTALGVTAGLVTPRPAMSVTCTPVDQACVHCSHGFANCTAYECSDGTSRISCSSCGLCI